jgi:hypothetical protein
MGVILTITIIITEMFTSPLRTKATLESESRGLAWLPISLWQLGNSLAAMSSIRKL